jgi:acyl dehydratase
MIPIPDGVLGRQCDLGRVTVTAEMIATYAAAVGDTPAGTESTVEAPPTFCLALRRGMTPEITLPADMFGVYGGHDLEFYQPIRAGETYRISGCVADVYEKMGRSGRLIVVVRDARIHDSAGHLVARIVERQIVRQRPPAGAAAERS